MKTLDLFKEYTEKISVDVLDKIKGEAEKRSLTKTQIEGVLKMVQEEYEKAKINPGEAIGVITAESFGEPGTQMTLNVFHFAGIAEANVTLGLPRLIEIFDARKDTSSTPSMEIYLKKPYNKDPDRVRKIASAVKETRLREAATEFSVNFAKLQAEVKLDKIKLKELSLTPKQVVDILSNALKEASVKEADGSITLRLKESEELNEVYRLKEKIKEIVIKGVKDIKQVLPIKKENEFIIITSGSNLKEVLKIDEIDSERTISNDLFEIAKIFGIEAARTAIINESLKVIENQGLDIDIRHIMFVADAMTISGEIKGITRSGITSEKESVLARASFETPLKHIINASLIGERDRLNSVIENVIINQLVPLGTGLPDLVLTIKRDSKDEKQTEKKVKGESD